MFLSESQIELIDAAKEKPLDILDAHVSTVSALASRGLMEVNYARRVVDITTVQLTATGAKVAENLDFYREPPKFHDLLFKNSKAKKIQRKRHPR